MAMKPHCDICDTLMVEANLAGGLEDEVGKLRVKIACGFGTLGSGQVCVACIRKALSLILDKIEHKAATPVLSPTATEGGSDVIIKLS
jgi:hypothetical protein